MHCKACLRADEITAALAQTNPRTSISAVARGFKLSKTSLLRHIANHAGRRNPGPALLALATSPAPLPLGTPKVTKDAFPVPPGLPEACTICATADLRALEEALMRGATYGALERAHTLEPGSVRRHATRCCPSLLAYAGDMAASASDENGEPETAGQRALAAADSAKRLLGLAEASADLRARAQALTACVKAIESLARFTDESKLKESAGWKAAMALIVKVLPSYPAALAAVVAALEA